MEENVVVLENESGNIRSCLEYFLKFKLARDLQILDIGCNYGSLIYNLYRRGYHKIYGIDIRQNAISIGKNEYPAIKEKLKCSPANRIPFHVNQFDVVLMFDVIEHIPQIESYLKEVKRVLKREGLVLFQTPNKMINVPWEIIKKRNLTAYKVDHCSLQFYGSLKNILKVSGFKQITIEKFNILTEFNKSKVRKAIGPFGVGLLYCSSLLPLLCYPNFWGYMRK